MSAAALTSEPALSPIVCAAARGELPDWARASQKRRAHIGRVAALLGEWADGLGLPEHERTIIAAYHVFPVALFTAAGALLGPKFLKTP